MHKLIDSAVALHFALMALVGFIVAYIRIGMQHKRTSFKAKISEALLCSFLSTAVCQIAYLHFGLSYDYGFPISVFVGFLGSEWFNSFLIGVIKYHGNRSNKGSNSDDK